MTSLASSESLADERPSIHPFSMLASQPPDAPTPANGPSRQGHLLKQAGPLGLVILLHIGFFYVMQSGLMQQPAPPEPKEIVAILIAAQPAPAPKPAAPQPPLPQPVPKPAKPVKPVVTPKPPQQPAPKAITTQAEPAPAPAPAEPAAATAPANSAPATATPGPVVPAAPVQPRTVTSGVEYLQPPRPEYPALSRRMGEEGTVMLRILITERGRAERADIHKSSGVPRLDEAARQAALRAVFKPYTENGRPVPVYAILPISFQLDN
ncbi:energy transducer TonB [Noviherbaspirillum sedimenti]|uniref:Energy transducer TonB n=1 Tax=Noviherbaspirillum sedimenti TaxID=2320865 RepID=A0A3A3G788_9BURK|nr:energy transducer TonB [Noviherbaspirillum sedimenti]RJG04377.1 energy transducer TonB [Noviherbaspirillum sedimenti]